MGRVGRMRELEYSRVYRGSVAAAIRRLRAELADRGFTVFSVLAVHDFLRRTGRGPVEPVAILDVGSPDLFHRALTISRQAALLLPCKFIISREDGETLIALQRPALTTHLLLPIPTLFELNDLVERSLGEAVDATVGPRSAADLPPVFVTIDQTIRRLLPAHEPRRRLRAARHPRGHPHIRPTITKLRTGRDRRGTGPRSSGRRPARRNGRPVVRGRRSR